MKEWKRTDSDLNNKTVIVDYDAGNLKSIANILKYVDEDFLISSNPQDLKNAKRLIFPGQGHFRQAVENLDRKNLIGPIKSAIEAGKPFLGICLGLQILFEKSEEAPNFEGLAILKGEVKKFSQGKVPQIGWNKIKTTANNDYLAEDFFYFVNSYYVEPNDKNVISSITNYHIDFCSSIQNENLTAVQFHPEKSAQAGIDFFTSWIGKT